MSENDIMHDVLHGVANYVLRVVVYDFIFEKNYFTLQELNRRINIFKCTSGQGFNKPPEFLYNSVKNKISLKCSASETLTLLRFLGLIIGDLIKNFDDDHWKLFILLRKITDIILSPRVTSDYVDELKILVKKLLSLYIKEVGELKPKFHYLTHYARFLMINGPLVNFWTIRFESRHRALKTVANVISCTIDLLTSIATKEAFKMFHMFQSFLFDSENHEEEPEKKIFKQTLKNVELRGSTYDIGMIVVVNNNEIEKIFGEIVEIHRQQNSVEFLLRLYEEVTFDNHVHAYILQDLKQDNIIRNFEDLPPFPPCFTIKKDDVVYCITQYRL